MKNKKGFTLIELLAVIVILAIIALIATPIILNMIENAKKGAAKDSAYGYIEAIDFQNSMSGIDSEKYKMVGPGEDLDVNSLDVKVKGSKPSSGTVTIDSTGRVTSAELCITGYNILYDGKEANIGNKSCGGSNSSDDEIIDAENAIYTKVESLVYDETGKCKSEDTYEYMGGCYIKGESQNNYIWYNGFMWRIMGINSDKTIRLITNENVTAIPFGSSTTTDGYTTNENYIHSWLNEYFLNNLNSTKSIIQEGNYFCSEPSIPLTDDTVRIKCASEKEIKARVGLISLDEYYLAGEKSSYLKIGKDFWTMTSLPGSPAAWYGNYEGNAYIQDVITSRGIRPVINIKANSLITKGSGTSTDYYILIEDKTSNTPGVIGNAVTSGEYVKLEGKIYRVVSKNQEVVKLVLDGYYDNIVEFLYQGSDNTFTTTKGIGATLNTDVLTWLGLNNSTKIKETTWYQGTAMNSGDTYKKSLTEIEGTGITAKVGLIRIGEMLSGSSATITKTASYVTMTPQSTNCAWYIYYDGYAHFNGVSNAHSVRPVIAVKKDLPINGGVGTPSSPYEI